MYRHCGVPPDSGGGGGSHRETCERASSPETFLQTLERRTATTKCGENMPGSRAGRKEGRKAGSRLCSLGQETSVALSVSTSGRGQRRRRGGELRRRRLSACVLVSGCIFCGGRTADGGTDRHRSQQLPPSFGFVARRVRSCLSLLCFFSRVVADEYALLIRPLRRRRPQSAPVTSLLPSPGERERERGRDGRLHYATF